MKQLMWIAAAAAIAGCGPKSTTVATGPNGESVVSTQDGTKTTYSDSSGRSATFDANAGTVTGHDEKGNSYSVGGSVTEADLGLPFYPDSVETKNGSMVSDSGDERDVLSSRTTKDDPDKVSAFYKDKITDAKDASSTAGDLKLASVSGKLSSGAEVTVTAMRKSGEDTQISVAVKRKKDVGK